MKKNQSKSNQNSSNFTVGTIACLKPGKNLFELIKAFKYAWQKNPVLKLEIIGDGPLRKNLAKYLIQHQLSPAITLLGWQKKPAIYTKNWDLFLFTSLWEGLPCSIVEMVHNKTPILSYQVGGINDLINQSELIYPGKWLNLGQKLLILSKNRPKPRLNSQLSGKIHDFYISKMVLDHIYLYKKLIPFE